MDKGNRRRGRILWPDEEEENIMGKIQLALRTTQQPPDKYLEESRRLYCLTNCLDEIFGISIINSHLSPSLPSLTSQILPTTSKIMVAWSEVELYQQRGDGHKIMRGSGKKIPRGDWGARGNGQTTPRSQSDCVLFLKFCNLTPPHPQVEPELDDLCWGRIQRLRVQSSHTIYQPASHLK